MTNRSSIAGIGFIVLSSLFFGLAPTFSQFAGDEGSTVVGTLISRFTIAAVIALAARIVFMRERPWPDRKTAALLLAYGGVGYFLGALFYFSALEDIDSSLAIVLFNCYPLFVVAFSWILFHHRPTPQVMATLVLTLIGVAITAGEVGSGQTTSVLLCLGSAILYTGYALGSSRALTRTDVMTGTTLVITGGAVSFWLYWLVGSSRVDVAFPDSLLGWTWVTLMGTVSTIGGVTLFFAGLNRIGPTKSSVAATSEPVMAIAAGALFLGEDLTIARVVGAIFVVLALVLLALFDRQPETVVVHQ